MHININTDKKKLSRTMLFSYLAHFLLSDYLVENQYSFPRWTILIKITRT